MRCDSFHKFVVIIFPSTSALEIACHYSLNGRQTSIWMVASCTILTLWYWWARVRREVPRYWLFLHSGFQYCELRKDVRLLITSYSQYRRSRTVLRIDTSNSSESAMLPWTVRSGTYSRPDWYMWYVYHTVSARIFERNVDYLRRQNELLLMPDLLFLEIFYLSNSIWFLAHLTRTTYLSQ